MLRPLRRTFGLFERIFLLTTNIWFVTAALQVISRVGQLPSSVAALISRSRSTTSRATHDWPVGCQYQCGEREFQLDRALQGEP